MDIKTVLASAGISAVVALTVPPLAASVTLQPASPGTPDSGSLNVSGNAIASRVGVNTVPGLARVQVNETGSLQGVRAVTNSGVSIYGQNTATTGLGAGGYFTSTSVGGRALVAEQISLNGNTIGGLFYNRSQSGGVALWGKHIGNSGVTTGVFGEVASSSGTAATFTNTASGTRVDLANGGVNAMIAKGDIKRDYGVNNYSAVPVAYGWIGSNGNPSSGTGNWTSTYNAVNHWYEITIPGVSFDILNGDTAVVTGLQPINCTFGVDSDFNGHLIVRCMDFASSNVQRQFMFVAYSLSGSNLAPVSPPVKNMTHAQWMQERPAEALAYQKKLQDARHSQVANPLPQEP